MRRREFLAAGAAAVAAAACGRVEPPLPPGALLATTLLGKGLFDGNPFALDIAGTFATDLGRELFAESDLVIAAGAGLGADETAAAGAAGAPAGLSTASTY